MLSYQDWKNNRPDMWGTDSSNPMWGVPPHDDEYYEKRKQSDFNGELYWAEREAEFWKQAAESFFWMCGGRNGCGDLDAIHHLCQHYAQWFEDNECIECGTNEDLFTCEGTDFDGYEGTYHLCRACKHELEEEGMNDE